MRNFGFLYVWVLLSFKIFDIGSAYRNILLENYLCTNIFFVEFQRPFKGVKTVSLEDGPGSAAVISQEWYPSTFETNSSNKAQYDCTFRVTSSMKGRKGIYILIPLLKLRRLPFSGACLDYVKFSGGNRPSSSRKCDIGLKGPALQYDERYQEVIVQIHIDKNIPIEEPLKLQMVFTAHSECQDDDFLCDPFDPTSCISQYLVGDNITNCFYPCRDEGNCHRSFNGHAALYDNNHHMLSPLILLLSLTLGIAFCIYISWKYWKCVKRQLRAHDQAVALHLHSYSSSMGMTPNEEDFLAFNLLQHHCPTRPPTPTRDPPPSYESLFPER